MAVALLLTPAIADATPSAFPLKAPGDSGVVDLSDFSPQGPDGPDWVRGYDACTYTKPYDNFTLEFPQYQVAGCVPVQSPWLELPHFMAISSWVVYCPASAPNSWVDSLGGALQQWSTDQSVAPMSEGPPGTNSFGPSPPAQSDYSTISGSASPKWWLYLVGCSPIPWESVGDGGVYCCGRGTSAIPLFRPPPLAAARSDQNVPRVRVAKGPPRLVHRTSRDHYSVTREFDLRADTTRTYTASCAAGYRMHATHSGIGWYTRRPPTAADGEASRTERREGGRYEVTVATTDGIRRGSVRLQMHIACSRRGDLGPPPLHRLPIR